MLVRLVSEKGNNMKKTMASVMLALCAVAAHAEPPSDASVARLLAASGASKMMDSIEPLIEKMVRDSLADMLGGDTFTPNQQKVMGAWPTKFAKLMSEEMTWAKMQPDMVRIYQESFDQAEVDGMTAFYESPVGQATVKKLPLVLSKSMALSQARMQTLMPKIQALLKETQEEMERAK